MGLFGNDGANGKKSAFALMRSNFEEEKHVAEFDVGSKFTHAYGTKHTDKLFCGK